MILMQNSPVEEIKNRLDIVDFINSHVPLKRAGANFAARCPFHNEKTPSFTVSRAKQLWYCFGACQEGGDIFKFLMKMEGLEFVEALKILADKAGVELPKYDKQAESRKNTLIAVLKAAQEFYAAQLRQSAGAAAGAYLKKRGLTDEVINRFGLGYAPDGWDALTLAFRDKFKAEDIFAAGLTIKRARNHNDPHSPQPLTYNAFYDRFRHRIMFPIRDIHGNTVGFTSRLLDENRKEGKYVNTPETPVYSKGRALYGLDLAREAIRKMDYAILVEGNMDVIACHQFGCANTVAASGTALTADQVRFIKRYTENLKVCFDADAAGETATARGIDIARAEGMQVKIVVIPAECGKDPDECIRKDRASWERAMREARDIMEYRIEKARARFDLKGARGLSQFVNAVLREMIKIPDLVEQHFWVKRVADMARLDEKIIHEQLGKLDNAPLPALAASGDTALSTQRSKFGAGQAGSGDLGRAGGGEKKEMRSRAELLSERILALCFFETSCAGRILGNVLPEMLKPDYLQALYTEFARCYNAYNTQGTAEGRPNFRQFWRNWLEKSVSSRETLSTADPANGDLSHYRADVLELYGDKEFDGWSVPQCDSEAEFLIREIRREYLKVRRRDLAYDMKQAEALGNIGLVAELAQEFKQLMEHE